MDQITNPQPRSKKLIIIIILIILVPTLIYYAIYFFRTKQQQLIFSENLPTQNNKEIENWNIYKNAAYGFEIKYPQAWKYEEPYPNDKWVNFYPENEVKSFATDKEFPVHIRFMKLKNKSLVDYRLKSQMDRKKYKLNDIEIIKFTPTTKDSMLNAIVYINDDIYEVWVCGFCKSNDRDIFEKMLPTLKTLK